MTKRRNNFQSANLMLGGVSLGFLLSYPFHSTFIGGLIASGCSAGMIGGLADWFAVTALFRRPLGIHPSKIIRTEIIPQNRERIFAILADMVQNELFSEDVLCRKLAAWDLSRALIKILKENEVQGAAVQILVNFIEDVVNQPESAEFKENVRGLGRENLETIDIPKILAELIQFSLKHGDMERLLNAFCRIISEFADQFEVSTALEKMIGAALLRYAGNNPARKMVGKFLPSPSVLAQGLRAKGKEILQDGTVERLLKERLLRLAGELKTNPSLQERLNLYLSGALESSLENPEIRKKIAAFLGIDREHRPLLRKRLLALLTKNWDIYLTKFENNSEFKLKLDKEVKDFLGKQIHYHHTAIGRMVREGLEPLTNDMLVELIEEKAGNDLQMIRINGSVVGSLAGMLLYILGVVLP